MDVFLAYGPDTWRANLAAKAFLEQRVSSLHRVAASDLATKNSDINALLSQPTSLFGERFGLLIEHASNTHTRTLTPLLAQTKIPVAVVAGALDARASLKRLFEGPDRTQTEFRLPTKTDRTGWIQTALRETPPAPDVLDLIRQRLPEDSGSLQSWLQTLALFCKARGRCGIDEVVLAIPNESNASVFALLDGLVARNPRAVVTLLPHLDEEPGIGLLRLAMRQFQSLAAVRAKMDQGGNALQAIQALRPPVPAFKHAALVAALDARRQGWTTGLLEAAMGRLTRAEIAIKRGVPPHIETAQALIDISRMRPPA